MTAADKDIQRIALREGSHIVFTHPSHRNPRILFMLTLAASSMLVGKPVVCKGMLPGISFCAQTSQPIDSVLDLGVVLWKNAECFLNTWVERAHHQPQVCFFDEVDHNDNASRTSLTFALESHVTLKGLAQFEIPPFWA